MSDSKLVVQIKLEGAQADFANAALDKDGDSNVGFATRALLALCSTTLGQPAPVKAVKARGAKKGSKIELANKLGLSTKEFKRRVKVLGLAGVPVNETTVMNVPSAPVRKSA